MPFKKNESGNPKGKPRGAVNHLTNDIKGYIKGFIENNMESLQHDFDQLESKDRLLIMEKLFKYVIPAKVGVEDLGRLEQKRQVITLPNGAEIEIG